MSRMLNLASILLALAVTPALAQGIGPYAGEQTRAVKALSVEETRDLLEGRGMGLAKAAELNRHPGPMHVLDLAEPLGLSENDAVAIRRVFEAMQVEARALGREILAAEGGLDQLFAQGAANPAAIEVLTAKIGALQGRLRAVHLNAHLAIRPLLASDTVARYDNLRGYAGEPARGHAPGAHPHRH